MEDSTERAEMTRILADYVPALRQEVSTDAHMENTEAHLTDDTYVSSLLDDMGPDESTFTPPDPNKDDAGPQVSNMVPP